MIAAEILRQSHTIAYNALYGLEWQVYEAHLYPIYTQNYIDVLYHVAKQGQYIYLDLVTIMDAVVAQTLTGLVYIYLPNWQAFSIADVLTQWSGGNMAAL